MSLEDATIFNMWEEIAAIVEVLEQKAAEACGYHNTGIEEGKRNRWALQNLVPISPSAPKCAFVSIME